MQGGLLGATDQEEVKGCRRLRGGSSAREGKGVKPWGREAWPENEEKIVERG